MGEISAVGGAGGFAGGIFSGGGGGGGRLSLSSIGSYDFRGSMDASGGYRLSSAGARTSTTGLVQGNGSVAEAAAGPGTLFFNVSVNGTAGEEALVTACAVVVSSEKLPMSGFNSHLFADTHNSMSTVESRGAGGRPLQQQPAVLAEGSLVGLSSADCLSLHVLGWADLLLATSSFRLCGALSAPSASRAHGGRVAAVAGVVLSVDPEFTLRNGTLLLQDAQVSVGEQGALRVGLGGRLEIGPTARSVGQSAGVFYKVWRDLLPYVVY